MPGLRKRDRDMKRPGGVFSSEMSISRDHVNRDDPRLLHWQYKTSEEPGTFVGLYIQKWETSSAQMHTTTL